MSPWVKGTVFIAWVIGLGVCKFTDSPWIAAFLSMAVGAYYFAADRKERDQIEAALNQRRKP